MAISSCLGVLWLAWQGEGCFIIGKFRFFQTGTWLGALSSFSCAVGTAGTWPSRAGPYFFEEIGERTPRGRRFLPLGTPFSGGKNGGRWLVRLEPGLRPPEPTPHGPPTGSGGREKWFVDGRKKWETKWFFSSFSQRVPVHVPSPPSRWAGRYGPSSVRAAGQVFRQKYSLPPTQPHQRRESRGKNLFPLGFFPPFLPKKWGPGRAGHRSLPFQRRGRNPATPPPPQNAASNLCLYEAVFSHCQTFSLQQDAAG